MVVSIPFHVGCLRCEELANTFLYKRFDLWKSEWYEHMSGYADGEYIMRLKAERLLPGVPCTPNKSMSGGA